MSIPWKVIVMCGIAGLMVDGNGAPLEDALQEMSKELEHRGPDSYGNWLDSANGVGFAHRRLAIVDRSIEGSQPMVSANGRLVLSFNGEIYNHIQLRETLSVGSGVRWRGNSDTETLLSIIQAFGIRRALSMAIGMFSFALWDRESETLTLARDRLGEKPLYYGYMQGSFGFGSELGALRRIKDWTFSLDTVSLSHYMQFGFVPEPRSIFRNIFKLPPGTFLEVSKKLDRQVSLGEPEVYWSLAEIANPEPSVETTPSNVEESASRLEKLLLEVIESQLIGDVPIGAFLSGGIDSSLVVGLMQKIQSKPIHTFSIGFKEKGYDESLFAQQIAQHLGTQHFSETLTEDKSLQIIERIPKIFGEPFADSSQLPTWAVSELARRYVTVSLTGDGGDEVFGGYSRYVDAARNWRLVSKVPRRLRSVFPALEDHLSPKLWNFAAPVIGSVLPYFGKSSEPATQMRRAFALLRSKSDLEMNGRQISLGSAEDTLKFSSPNPYLLRPDWPIQGVLSQRMMALDSITSLPGAILTKVDRAGMNHSLETRMPFLDKRVVEFAWSRPVEEKISGDASKILLRKVLEKYVPQKLTDRPKMGFGIPLGDWLRGGLKNWANDHLNRPALDHADIFNTEKVMRMWQLHSTGSINFQNSLWTILMYLEWQRFENQSSRACESQEVI
jgi:asparagine synthase (glutamine-hydrolysing)